jgi:hypothetical protein
MSRKTSTWKAGKGDIKMALTEIGCEDGSFMNGLGSCPKGGR